MPKSATHMAAAVPTALINIGENHLIRELSFFSWTGGPGKMQVGPFLKILKNKRAKFSEMSYFGGYVLKTNLLAKKIQYLFYFGFSVNM